MIATKTKNAVAAAIVGSALLLSGCGVFSKELRTELIIDSSPEKVWSALTDFEQFPNWNPMIRKVEGQPEPGEKLSVFVQAKGAKGMAFTPTVTKVEPNRELRWLGTLGISGLFDGEHIFTLEATDDNSIKFVHREQFNGLLIPILMPFIQEDTLRGFGDMNLALKTLVEGLK